MPGLRNQKEEKLGKLPNRFPAYTKTFESQQIIVKELYIIKSAIVKNEEQISKGKFRKSKVKVYFF